MTLAQRIKELRFKQNITLSELAKRSGVGKATLSRIENNLTSPSIKSLNKIAKALNMDIRKLLAVVDFK
jgi:transcriptional regulator with XRE-family HTH domain